MVSIIEFDYDKQMKNSSWVINISKTNAEKIFFILVTVIVLVVFLLIPFVGERIKLTLFIYQIMAIGHLIIYRNKQLLLRYLAYRKFAEILFWIPALIYFFK